MNIVSETVSIIFEALHKSHASLHSDNPAFEHQAIRAMRFLDFACLAHNVLVCPLENKRNATV